MTAFQTYQSLTGKLNYALFLALLIALPLPRFILQPIAVAWIISWVLECRFCNKENWRWTNLAIPGILLVVLTLWELVSLLWAPDTHAGLRHIERHWAFVVLVVVPLFGVNGLYRAEKLLSVLFASCVVSVPLYLFTSYWVWNADAVIWFQYELLRPYEFPTFHGFTSLIKLRSYYCPVLLLSILSTPLLYRHYRKRYPKWEVLFTLGVGVGVLVAGILMTGSRTAILALGVTSIFLVFVTYRKQLRWWWQALIVVVGLSAGIAALVCNPRFSYLTTTDLRNINIAEASEANEPRFFIWKIVLSHADDYPFFGLGAGQHCNFLTEQYVASGNDFLVKTNYGTHCQYFSYWMCLGPLAVLFLLAIFYLIPKSFKGTAHYSAHAVAFLYVFLMLSDDMLERMDSVITFLVWMVMLYVIETTFDKSISASPSPQSGLE